MLSAVSAICLLLVGAGLLYSLASTWTAARKRKISRATSSKDMRTLFFLVCCRLERVEPEECRRTG